jgi:phosphatidylglycerol:prolipoprotein diacylglycerol transferase
LLASTRVESLPVLPAQLGESIASLAIAAFCLLVVHPRKRYDGHVFVVFVVLYAVARFLLEFFRADDRGGILALSTSQWVGVVLVAAAAVFHFRRLKSLPAIP